MPRHRLQYPKTVGVRLTLEDGAKLRQLCDATQQPPGEFLRPEAVPPGMLWRGEVA